MAKVRTKNVRRNLGGFLLALGLSLMMLCGGTHLPLLPSAWLVLVGGILEMLRKEEKE